MKNRLSRTVPPPFETGYFVKIITTEALAKLLKAEARPGIQDFQAILDSGACPGPDPGFAGMTD